MSLLPIGRLRSREYSCVFVTNSLIWEHYSNRALPIKKIIPNHYYLWFYNPLMPEGMESYTMSMVQFKYSTIQCATLLLENQLGQQERLLDWKEYGKEWFLMTLY